MRKTWYLSIIIMVCIMAAAFVPATATYAETANDAQSSFEYKHYKNTDLYKAALKRRMSRVYTSIGGYIDDNGTIPIPGLLKTYTTSGGVGEESSSFVPQGLCKAGNYILLTAYHAKKKQNSVIYAIDSETNRLVSTLTIPNRYHLGGISFDGTNIWITGDTSDNYKGEPFVQYIRYDDFQNMITEPVYEVADDEISEPVYIKNKPSFLECDNGILWVGTYIGRGSTKRGYMNGYKIRQGENGPVLNTFMYSVITGIDSSAQGADIVGNYMYVSSSYGGAIEAIKSSFVTKYNISKVKSGDTNLNVTERELKRVEVPKMNEEILVTASGILMNFEAAADCFKVVVIATDRLLAVDASVWR